MKGRFGVIGPERCEEFISKGYRQRWFFAHAVRILPKGGPDAFKIARWMLGDIHPDQMWELVVHADESVADQFPADLFFDNDIVWHQQQLGHPGQVASANLVVRDSDIYTMVHISDLVQRISRRRDLKTQIENRFKGWNHMLLNGILHFAAVRGLERIHVARSGWALKHTDPARNPGHEMFERIYDRNVHELFDVTESPEWWCIDVERNRNRLVEPEEREEVIEADRTICVCHDIEGGLGHAQIDPTFAARAEASSSDHLTQMLDIERGAGVTATYAVVGEMIPVLREQIERDGHCLAFHSFDHRLGEEQLGRCRSVDYRLKGYRTPQSVITSELTDENLNFHSFEWLANSAWSFGFDAPRLENRIVKIPVDFDDFAMYHDGMSYETWEADALARIEKKRFVAFGLHDCYGEYWLSYYSGFLEKVRRMGRVITLNQVANEVFLGQAHRLHMPTAEIAR